MNRVIKELTENVRYFTVTHDSGPSVKEPKIEFKTSQEANYSINAREESDLYFAKEVGKSSLTPAISTNYPTFQPSITLENLKSRGMLCDEKKGWMFLYGDYSNEIVQVLCRNLLIKNIEHLITENSEEVVKLERKVESLETNINYFQEELRKLKINNQNVIRNG